MKRAAKALSPAVATARPGLPGWRAWAAVAVGGLIGTELRYGAGLAFPEAAGTIPWTTLVINVVGSFVLAALTTVWIARPKTAFWLRAGLGPGLLGSFTTFSAVVFAIDQQFRAASMPAGWPTWRSRSCWDSPPRPPGGRPARPWPT